MIYLGVAIGDRCLLQGSFTTDGRAKRQVEEPTRAGEARSSGLGLTEIAQALNVPISKLLK